MIARMTATASSVSCGRCRGCSADGSTCPIDQGHRPTDCGASSQAANSVAVIDGIAKASDGFDGCGRDMVNAYHMGMARGSPSSSSPQRQRSSRRQTGYVRQRKPCCPSPVRIDADARAKAPGRRPAFSLRPIAAIVAGHRANRYGAGQMLAVTGRRQSAQGGESRPFRIGRDCRAFPRSQRKPCMFIAAPRRLYHCSAPRPV